MTKFEVGCSPITSIIYAGSVLKNGKWGKKHDVTDSACNAVAQHLIQKKESITFNLGEKRFRLLVEEIA